MKVLTELYRGADNSLTQSGRKQANVSVRMARVSFGALLCRKKKPWWQLASRCCWNRACPCHASELVSYLVGVRTYQHPGSGTNTGSSKTDFSLPQRPKIIQSPHSHTSELGFLNVFGTRDLFEILVKHREPLSEKSIKMHKIEIVRDLLKLNIFWYPRYIYFSAKMKSLISVIG